MTSSAATQPRRVPVRILRASGSMSSGRGACIVEGDHGRGMSRSGDVSSLHASRPPKLALPHGTVCFSVSIQKRAASKASLRCGEDTATTTVVSESSTRPIRWWIAIASRRTTFRAPRRPPRGSSVPPVSCSSRIRGQHVAASREWSRTTPLKVTTAPQLVAPPRRKARHSIAATRSPPPSRCCCRAH